MPHGIDIRPTHEIDDPTWEDVRQRDALIRWLAHIVGGQFEQDERPNTVLILDSVDEALAAIGDPMVIDDGDDEDSPVPALGVYEGYAGSL